MSSGLVPWTRPVVAHVSTGFVSSSFREELDNQLAQMEQRVIDNGNRNTEDLKRRLQEEGAKTRAHTQKEGEKTRACIREEATRTRAEVTDLKRTYAALRAAMEGRRPADVVEP